MVQIELHDILEATVHYQPVLDLAQALAREVKLSDLREPGVPDLVDQKFCGEAQRIEGSVCACDDMLEPWVDTQVRRPTEKT